MTPQVSRARRTAERPDPGRSAAWPGTCSSGSAVTRTVPPSILMLARPGPESDDLFAELSEREDLCLVRVATPAAAARTVEDMPVALVVASPEMPGAAVDAVASHLAAVRPGTPVLAVLERQAEEPAGWSARGVAVLRRPLLEGVLSRTVDVVLGMTRRS